MSRRMRAAILISGALGLGLAGAAFAHDHGPGGFRGHGRWSALTPEDRAAFTDARIAALHAGLKLTPDQEKLWPPVEAAIRFHLHPTVRASRVGRGVRLAGAGAPWLFEADELDPVIEESVFFAALNGARRTEQIVLHLTVADGTRVAWRFRRLAD